MFDEIFDGLDPVIRELVKKILIDFVSTRDACVVIASHNLRELEDVCDSVCLIHSGGILADADVDSLKLGLTKLQLILQNETDLQQIEDKLNILKMNQKGKIIEITVRGDREEITRFIDSLNPAFSEILPLTLEEVFISEMEVAGYEISNIIIKD